MFILITQLLFAATTVKGLNVVGVLDAERLQWILVRPFVLIVAGFLREQQGVALGVTLLGDESCRRLLLSLSSFGQHMMGSIWRPYTLHLQVVCDNIYPFHRASIQVCCITHTSSSGAAPGYMQLLAVLCLLGLY